MDGLLIFFAFELYCSLFHILVIENGYRVDRAHFNFLLKFCNWYWSYEINQSTVYKKEFMLKGLIQIHQIFKAS